MSGQNSAITNRRLRILPPSRVDAHGQRMYRWCGSPVKPPRRYWCSQACVEEYMVRANPMYARQKVWERDKGVCADPYMPRPHVWEADHIIPVVEGGGATGLDNLRTLCIPCHRAETAKLARRRAETRRKVSS